MIGVELPPNYGELYTSSFKKMYVDLANEYNINLVKGSLIEMVSSNLMQSDGIHPNQAGHVLIEQGVLKEIVPILLSVTD
jgi:acyl-CoA thioesterase-1